VLCSSEYFKKQTFAIDVVVSGTYALLSCVCLEQFNYHKSLFCKCIFTNLTTVLLLIVTYSDLLD
jgi:hypothetical protein